MYDILVQSGMETPEVPIRSMDEVRAREGSLFWETPGLRLIDIAAVAGKHLHRPDDILDYVFDIQYELEELPQKIEDAVSAREGAERPATAGKPNVHFVINHTDKGNLRVSYFPEFPRDFGQFDWEYKHHGGRNPVNTLLFIKRFDKLWRSQRELSDDPQLDLKMALRRELLGVLVRVVEFSEAEIGKRFKIISRWQFLEDEDGQIQLLNPEEVKERERTMAADKEAADEAAVLDRSGRPKRERRALLDQCAGYYGIDPGRLVALMEAFQPSRVPFEGRVTILVRHFGMTTGPVPLSPTTIRRLKIAMSALDMPIPAAEITDAEARTLAKKYLGRIRSRH